MNPPVPFQPYGVEHLTVIALTIVLPFALAALVRRWNSTVLERAIVYGFCALFIANYIAYLAFIRDAGDLRWGQMLPMQMCDWAIVAVLVALISANQRWFEVAYFWGIGGTLQAMLTPNLHYGFPDPRFIGFFVSHCGIIVAVVFLMLTRRLRPYPMSIVRVFAWSEVYFVAGIVANYLTGENYGYLRNKPDTFSLLSYLSDSWPVYLLQMHALALAFFAILYAPFAITDTLINKRGGGVSSRVAQTTRDLT